MDNLDRYEDEDLLAAYEQALADAAEPLHPTGDADDIEDGELKRLLAEIRRRGLEEECRRRGLGPPT